MQQLSDLSSSSSMTPAPRLSIGLPVYNGAHYVGRAIESLLAQTFRDFELIITDNASTDGTEGICRAFAESDPRVRYFRAERNQGVVENFNWCFRLARGEYFKWNASDDLCAPTFLEKCVAILDADPSVVLAFPRTMLIDDQDQPKGLLQYDSNVDHPSPWVRFSRMMHLDPRRHASQEIYGVIRRSALQNTPLYQPCVRTDSILLARLAIEGRFRRVEEPLFLNREHERRSVRLVPGERVRVRSRLSRWVGVGPIPPAEFWNPASEGRIVFPEWRILREYLRSPLIAPVGLRQRLLCLLAVAPFAIKHIPKLVRDVVISSEHLVLGIPGTPRAR